MQTEQDTWTWKKSLGQNFARNSRRGLQKNKHDVVKIFHAPKKTGKWIITLIHLRTRLDSKEEEAHTLENKGLL
jgi:hypothetical protein